ncbi:helicase associated domain-containing protein [Streptomyces lydicus]|uniref:helicase associated domain-containing protein n=1 Tax=Streptomyces lydicus TaxID=47763 RepID=UPI001010A50C|nr:helicase associated domain-containing protein [Streptomyces lydicus]MCZ1011859.1 helicase associated domain-containing protein [Streptomyces lydicus]
MRIAPYWNPTWLTDWQRRYAALAAVLADGATLAEILPGVTVGGQDIGAWLHAQRTGWEQLGEEQRARLAELGVEPLPAAEKETPVKEAKARKGVTASLSGHRSPGPVQGPRRAHEGPAGPHRGDHGGGRAEPVSVRLGVFLSNTKSRRDKLTADALQQLADLGLDWAAA